MPTSSPVDRRLVLGALGVGVAALVAVATMDWRGGRLPSDAGTLVTVSDSGGAAFVGPAVNSTPWAEPTRSGLSHRTPPPLETLRDRAELQGVYDAEAQPGDFVTPPVVSVEH